MSTDDHQPPDRPHGGYDPVTRSQQRADQARGMQRGLNAAENRQRRLARSTVRIHPDDDPDAFEYFYLETVLTTRSTDADAVAGFLADRHPELHPERVTDEPVPGVTTFTVPGVDDVTRLCDELDELRPGIAMPDHVVHVTPTGCCPATEPKSADHGPVPGCSPDVDAGDGVSVVVVDSGRQPAVEAHADWLRHGVTGTLEDEASSGHYVGHGTFVCGVLRTQAPKAAIDVNALHFVAGAVVESDLARQLWSAVHDDRPQIISMSAGTTTRKGYPPIALEVVCEALPASGTLLVAAAGNDTSDEHFFPAYFSHDDAGIGQTANPHVVSVGALGPDKKLAWYSNHTWPSVYAQGSTVVNAYPNGTYAYRERPMKGKPDAEFRNWLASWDGTSFATPLVAGLIAARMTKRGETASAAWAALYRKATSQRGVDSGPSLFPGDAG